jgi:hypothetical protein
MMNFLDQDFYNNTETSIMSDYRYIYKANFRILHNIVNEEKGYYAIVLLKKEK